MYVKCLECSQVVFNILTAHLTNILLILLVCWKHPIPGEIENDSFTFLSPLGAQKGHRIQFCPLRHKGSLLGFFWETFSFPTKGERGGKLSSFLLRNTVTWGCKACTCCRHPVTKVGDTRTLWGWEDREVKRSNVADGNTELVSQPWGCLPMASLVL